MSKIKKNSSQINYLENNKLIAEFMGVILPKNTLHKLEIQVDNDKEPKDYFEYEVRDFDNNPTFNYHLELEDPNDSQAVYHPMVLKYMDRYFIYGKSGYHKSVLNKHPEITKKELPFANAYGLNYYKDWNLLMPVVEKIESLEVAVNNYVLVTIGSSSCCWIEDRNGNVLDIYKENYSKIICVYLAVVEFIKWYNKNNKN